MRLEPSLTARPRARARVSDWTTRWRMVLPLLFAEFVLWIGFGGLLPVLPIYLTSRGIDLTTLGLITAAWPAARLVSEPVFGWIADRTVRVPIMVAGLIASGIFGALPLVASGAGAFIALRALSGLGAAIYDPAARGFMTDAVPPERHGEAFGLYGAAQMGGLFLGPAIGALGASFVGGYGFVFVFSGLTSVLAAVVIGVTLHEGPRSVRHHARPPVDLVEFPPHDPRVEGRAASNPAPEAPIDTAAAAAGAPGGSGGSVDSRPRRLLNAGLVAALVLQFASWFSGGTYDVIWSLFLQGLGADLALIGLTFAMFGLPVLLFSPFAGRLVDRRGPFAFIVVGMVLPAIAGVCYTLISDPVLAVPLILVEATGFAMMSPALFTVVAASAPPGRSSTAQGLFGAAGTLGFIAASLAAGALADIDILYPFYLFVVIILVGLALGLLIGGPALRAHPADRAAERAPG